MARPKQVIEKIKEGEAFKALPAPEPQGPYEDPKVLKMTEKELLEAKLAEAKVKIAETQAMVVELQKKLYLAKVDPQDNLGLMAAKLSSLDRERAGHMEVYNAIFKTVEERLGIQMSDFSWDDETGILRSIA